MRLALIALVLAVASAAVTEGDMWWMPSSTKGPTDGEALPGHRPSLRPVAAICLTDPSPGPAPPRRLSLQAPIWPPCAR